MQCSSNWKKLFISISWHKTTFKHIDFVKYSSLIHLLHQLNFRKIFIITLETLCCWSKNDSIGYRNKTNENPKIKVFWLKNSEHSVFEKCVFLLSFLDDHKIQLSNNLRRKLIFGVHRTKWNFDVLFYENCIRISSGSWNRRWIYVYFRIFYVTKYRT